MSPIQLFIIRMSKERGLTFSTPHIHVT